MQPLQLYELQLWKVIVRMTEKGGMMEFLSLAIFVDKKEFCNQEIAWQLLVNSTEKASRQART